jgi:hypothetical protein
MPLHGLAGDGLSTDWAVVGRRAARELRARGRARGVVLWVHGARTWRTVASSLHL